MISFPRAPARRPGQALVETALALFILLLVIFGGIDLIHYALVRHQVAEATREAVHTAAVTGDPARGEDVAKTVLESGLGTSADLATITVECETPSCPRYSAMTVQITYRGSFLVPIGPLSSMPEIQQTLTMATEIDHQTTGGTP